MELDLIFSIGPACRPAYHLKQHFLRLFSCPLDYQMSYSLDTVLHLFHTSFKDFFAEIIEDKTKKGARNNRRIIDTANNITSIHHFPCDIPLDEAQTHFRSIMLKRYRILNTAILNSDTVGLLCNRNDTIEDLAAFLFSFGEIYPNTNFILINIRHNQALNSVIVNEHKFNSRYCIREYSFCDIYQHVNDTNYDMNMWLGNMKNWNYILQDFCIKNHPFAMYVKDHIPHITSHIYIYGAGLYCHKIINFLSKYNIKIKNIIVTSLDGNPSSIEGYTVIQFSDIPMQDNTPLIIISVVDQTESQKISDLLKASGLTSIIRIDSLLRPL